MVKYTDEKMREAMAYLVNYCAEKGISGLTGEDKLIKVEFKISSNVVMHYNNPEDKFIQEYLDKVDKFIPSNKIGDLK